VNGTQQQLRADVCVANGGVTAAEIQIYEQVMPSSLLIPVTYDITMNFNETHGLHMRAAARSGLQQQQQQQVQHELVGAAVAAAR
jgi:hypothetical protein